MALEKLLYGKGDIEKAIDSIARRVYSDVKDADNFAIVGVQTRGVEIAERIRRIIEGLLGKSVPSGDLDITFYRDDLATRGVLPVMKETRITFNVTNKIILLVDDVIFTGRTAKAALETLTGFGRPRSIKLMALVDRGSREFPIQPDYAGFTVRTGQENEVRVRLDNIDKTEDSIILIEKDN